MKDSSSDPPRQGRAPLVSTPSKEAESEQKASADSISFGTELEPVAALTLPSPTSVVDPPPAACEEVTRLEEGGQPIREFSVDGYAASVLRVERVVRGRRHAQCIVVAWPAGRENSAGTPTRVAKHIDAAWFRAIENTLLRLPAVHAETVHRIVIDNHPTQHGIAAFDRAKPDDGRDGRTIWLHEHLFMDPNHWERGIRGDYFAYHTNVDSAVIDDQPEDHELFSPILLHEIGHLVMYHLVNPKSDALSPPECARTCSDDGTCATLPIWQRELPCISPYCRPFKYMASTENWAEQYRFYYQSSTTRSLLADASERHPNCLGVLQISDDGSIGSPWERGFPDVPEFHRSRWDSCGGRACKPW